MNKEDKIDLERRVFLRRATSTVGGLGLAAAAVPFITYWMPSKDVEAAGMPVTVDISKLAPKEQLTISWRSMPIWIVSRTPEMLQTLPRLTSTLRDPNSDEAQQPLYCRNTNRSIKPEIFIAIGICTHLGCVPTYRPDVGGIDADWLGGFYCPCHGSKYDLAGRVYQGVPAPLNLKIPRHKYVSATEVLIGEDDEGVEGSE